MQIDKINTNFNNNKPAFKKMIIIKPEIWPAEVLDSFVKNKEVQELTKDWAKKGEDLTACCLCDSNSGIITMFKNTVLVHTLRAKNKADLQYCVRNFLRKDVKTHQISKEEQQRLDNVNKYIDEFNKTLEGQAKQTATKTEKRDKKPGLLSRIKKIFGK